MDVEHNKFQLRAVVAVCGCMIVATWWVSNTINGMHTAIDSAAKEAKDQAAAQVQQAKELAAAQAQQAKELAQSIEEVKNHSYTLERASEQALRTAIENPSLRVPDPRDPNRIIIVRSATAGPPASVAPPGSVPP
jgi:uncharacterized protein YlxW (UPF0749 family)